MDGAALSVTAADGRTLEVRTAGPERATALLLLTGTPTAGLPFGPLVDAAAARSLGFVTYSRPGYAGSARAPGRTVADCADDIDVIAGELGVERLHVVGWSGGGPHALAAAALLPGLVRSVATIGCPAPWEADGLDWTAGMGPENVAEFNAAAAGETVLERFLLGAAEGLRAVTGEEVADALGQLVDEVDRAALTGAFSEWTAASFRAAVGTGIWGWLDDDLAFVRDWGFDLSEIETPVTIWHGGHDRMVPFAHGEWLAAHIAGCRAELLPEEGHLSPGITRLDALLDGLLETA